MTLRSSLQRLGVRRPEPRIAKSREAMFKDVVITPYEELLELYRGASVHKGGPIWPDWDEQVFPRMCKKGRPRDARPRIPEQLADAVERAAWGGPIVHHFGHQVADFAMRLLPTRLSRPDLDIAFATHRDEGWSAIEDAPAFVGEILDWLDVPPERRLLIGKPTMVGELYVAEQAEQIGGPGPNDHHLDTLDELTDRRLGGLPPLTEAITYVSRAALTSRFAGESYLEQNLVVAGVRVLRPEACSLADQIRAYHSSERLVFAEGSAVHGLQLTGRLRADVVILERRNGSKLAKRSVERRTPSLRYAHGSRGIVHGILPSGSPALPVGISLLSADAAISLFRSLGIDLGEHWDEAGFKAVVEADVREWLSRQSERRRLQSDESDEEIIGRLRKLGFDDLASEAPAILARSRR